MGFIIWTESAFKKLSEVYGTLKGGAPLIGVTPCPVLPWRTRTSPASSTATRSSPCCVPSWGTQGLREQAQPLEEQGGDEEVEPAGQEGCVQGRGGQEEEGQGGGVEGAQQEAQKG